MDQEIQLFIKNPIKQHILNLLMLNPSLKYSELMPDNVENDLFNYHLQHLVKKELLQKKDQLYSLSNYGKTVTSVITTDGLYFPKFRVHIMYFLIDGDKILYNERHHTPWLGDTMPLTSKVWHGIKVEDVANDRFKDKTGFECKFKVIGTLRKIVFDKDSKLLDDSFYQIVYADKFEGNFQIAPDHYYTNIWVTFNEARLFENNNQSSSKETLNILDRLENKDLSQFYYEEFLHVDEL